jgi:hypothetical protein
MQGFDKQALGGILFLTVKKGKLLRDTELIGKMDPFIEIGYLGKSWRTTVLEEGGK